MNLSLNRRTFILAAGVGILALALTVLDLNALRIILVLPLVLFLPGFALTIILFQRERLGIPERLVLSVGLSVALTALLGLALHWTPWGLQPTALWITLFSVLVIEAVVIVFIRRRKWIGEFNLPSNPNFNARQWILVSLAAVMTLVAINVARAPTGQQGFEGYTTLWIQSTDRPDALHLGITSDEFKPTTYQIRFELNGVVRDGPILELDPGETWEGLLRLPTEPVAGKPLTVFLYRLDRPSEVYRHAVWWPESK